MPVEAIVRIDGDHVYISLNRLHLIVVAVGALIVLLAVFQAGRASARGPTPKQPTLENVLSGAPEKAAPAPSESTKTSAPPPSPNPRKSAGPVATPLGDAKPADDGAGQAARGAPARTSPPAPPKEKEKEKQAEKPKEPADTFSPVPNSYYIVIQHFRTRDRDKADAAREFLRGKGVESVVRTGGGDLELVATEAFSSEPPAQTLVRRILELGKEYRNSGGGYDFTGAKAIKH